MDYRVVLISNGKYKKTLHRCKKRETAFINFHKYKEKNNILFPKKFINTNGIKPVKFEICVTKPTESGDTFRIRRDDYGKLYTEEPLGQWTILHSDEYFVEETFWMYGYKSKGADRPDIKEIVKKLMVNIGSKNVIKQIIVVQNKLIIYNEDQFDMVLCKNIDDAQRLHHTLAKIADKQKIKNLLFMGTANEVMRGLMYDLIVSKTGWSRLKVTRKNTRP